MRMTDAGSIVAPNDSVQIALSFEDNRLASALFGQYDQNLALIERRLGIAATSRGNHVTLEGSRAPCEQARRVLESLYDRLKHGDELVQGDVDGTIRLAISQGSLFDFAPATGNENFEEINFLFQDLKADCLDGYGEHAKLACQRGLSAGREMERRGLIR